MTQLVRYEAARHALQVAHSVDEVKDIRDKAQAMAAYAKQANDTQLVEWATEIKVRAERRAGEMLREMDVSPGRPQKSSTDTRISDLGISYDQSSRWQKLAAIPEDRFEQAVTAAKQTAREVTTAALLRPDKPHVTNNSGENEWYTPPEYIEAARRVMGGIDFDPASSEVANRTVAAEMFCTVERSGLEQPWYGRVWMNPPYAQPLCANFCAAAAAKCESGEIEQACVLVNNATETAWFQSLLAVASAVCFLKGRVRYLDTTGQPANTPLQGQAVVYLGANSGAFAAEFRRMGTVLFHG